MESEKEIEEEIDKERLYLNLLWEAIEDLKRMIVRRKIRARYWEPCPLVHYVEFECTVTAG